MEDIISISMYIPDRKKWKKINAIRKYKKKKKVMKNKL